MKEKLHTESFGGNVHETATIVNKRGWAPYLISLHSSTGTLTIAVFRMPVEVVNRIRANTRSYIKEQIHADDPPDTIYGVEL